MNNSKILGEEAAARQIIEDDFSATNGAFEDDSVTNIKANAFNHKTSLVRAIFPNVTSVGDYAFQYIGSNLTHVNLPEATYVGTGAFSYIGSTSNRKASIILPKLSSCGRAPFQKGGLYLVDIGSSLSKLAPDSFYTTGQYTAKVLSNLILRKTDGVVTAPSKDTIKALDKVFVPNSLIESYKTASNWTYYYNQTNGISFYPLEDYTVDGTTTGEFDYALLATPTKPIYVVTNLDVSVDENHQRYITTTAEGHITYSSGAFTSENWSAVRIQSDEVGKSVSGNYFSIPAGSTVTIVIKNMTATQWNSVNGQRNQVSVRIMQSDAALLDVSWNDLKKAFYTDGLHRYEESYTNTGNSAITVVFIDLYGSLTPNNILDFGLMVLIDGVRII